MPASTEIRSGLFYGWDLGEDNWNTGMDANLLKIGRFGFHLSVIDRDLTTPPGSPVAGDMYIVGASATGAWSGKDGQVAIWSGSAWVYGVPRTGWVAFVEDEGALTVYDSGTWSDGTIISGVPTWSPPQAPNTSVDGLVLSDPTPATSGNQQYSPRLRLSGNGWKTDAVAASRSVDWIVENRPVEGTSNPSGKLYWSAQVNGGGYSDKMYLDSEAGTLVIGDGTSNITGYSPASSTLFWVQGNQQQELRCNSYHNSADNPTNLVLFKSRGTAASPSSVQNGDTIAGIIPAANSGGTLYHIGHILAVVNGAFTSGQQPPSRLDFYAGQANAALALQMSIAHGGVGIGTTNPNPSGYGRALTISDASNFVGFTMQYAGADADATDVGEYGFAATSNTGAPDTRVATIRGTTQGGTANWRGGKLTFRTRGNGGGLATAMTLNNDQTVVVGSSDPGGSATLRVNGGVSTEDPTSGGGPDWKLGSVKSGAVTASTTDYVEVEIGGVIVKLMKAT